MECLAVSKLPDGPQWIYEIKLDGYRAQAVKSDGNLTLFSKRRKSFNRQFPHIVEALSGLPENTVVDGEVLALDESGRPDFNLLQNFRAEASRIHYFVFNLLVYLKPRPYPSAAQRPPRAHRFTAEVWFPANPHF
jgi:ATP-dependent DNA ligase